MNTLSVLVIGPPGSGKSTYLNRMHSGAFAPSEQKEWNKVFKTSKGEVMMQCTLLTPQELSEYVGKPQGILQLFDLTQENQQREAPELTSVLNGLFPNVPGVLLGNKMDLKMVLDHRESGVWKSGVSQQVAKAFRDLGHLRYPSEAVEGTWWPLFETSALSTFNLETGFIHLLKSHIGEFQWAGV